jgi:phosphoribosylanthranilate isomerase
MVRVKICCIQSVEEAVMATRYGAHALGLVSKMPSGPGVIPEDKIRNIIRVLPPGISTVLLTSETTAAGLGKQLSTLHPTAIQLVLPVEKNVYSTLHASFPHLKIIQVIHVKDEQSLNDALAVSDEVDAILLDSQISVGGVTVFGGTGSIHDWELSRTIVQKVTVPVFLAGGLNPVNLRQAIDTIHPYAVDVCTGVRTEGTLDEFKLAAFMDISIA